MIRIPIWWISAELSHLYRKYSKRRSQVWYFAYGSNVRDANLSNRRIRVLESRSFVLPNYRRVFHHPSSHVGVGFADVVPAPGCEVAGRLLRISAADALWLHLDELVFPFSRYRIEWLSHDQLDLFFYRSNVPTPGLFPSERYLTDIITGLEDIGFAEAHIHDLRETLTATPNQRTGNSQYFVPNLSTLPRSIRPVAAWYEQRSFDLFKRVWHRSLFARSIAAHIPIENTPTEHTSPKHHSAEQT